MLPKLRIINLDDICPLMNFTEKQVEYFMALAQERGSIRNPLMLAPAGVRKYMLLEDGAVLEAARRMEIHQIPVQIATLDKAARVEASLYSADSVEPLLDEIAALFPRDIIIGAGGGRPINMFEFTRIQIRSGTQREITVNIRKTSGRRMSGTVFDFLTYLGRKVSLTDMPIPTPLKSTNLRWHDHSRVIRIENFDFEDLKQAVSGGYRFPSGMLKFELRCRIVGISYPLNVLQERAPLREKERFLHDLMQYRLNTGHPEFFRGGVYLIGY